MIKTVEQYLNSNPEASLKEYNEYVKTQTRKESTEAFENLRKCKEWYEQLTGRYFMINFNNTSFRAVYIDKHLPYRSSEKYMTYGIIVDDKECSISYKNTYINSEWFKCPYDSTTGKGVEEVREISEDEYGIIVAQYQRICGLFYKMKLK